MARKLRTGFELPFGNIGSDAFRYFIPSSETRTKDIINGDLSYSLTSQYVTDTSVGVIGSTSYLLRHNTEARSLRSTRGALYSGHVSNSSLLSLDLTAFASGFYMNAWIYLKSVATNEYPVIWYGYDATDRYQAYIDNSGTNTFIRIAKNSADVSSIDLGSKLSASTWYNVNFSLANNGDITYIVNGSSACSYSTAVTFSSFTIMGIIGSQNTKVYWDDLSINDGSGASDNGLPGSIRAYNFFDPVTVYTNSGFTAVGGSTVIANLQDGSDSTRVSASADLSYIDFSLPALSGTGMSETAANFTKIEAINVYGRQIESTKASSLLKAKVTDTVAVVNREENLTLPLTVGNDSLTMFNDGSSDWVLANLDSGDMDFRVTFDKP